MKKLPLLHKGAGRILGLACLAAASFHPLPAQNAAQNQIIQNKMDEQEVRLHTAAVVAQIQGLIEELSANGISGDDIKVLAATKAALTNLSGPEMDRVIASLQKAGEAPDAASGQQNAVSAYAGQKGIILQFRQILKDYEQRQAAYDLPVRFKELADRQTETLLTSANVARATAGKSASELTGMQATTEQIAQADQAAIGNDTNLAADQLKKAAQDSTDDDAKTMQQAQKDMDSGVLQQALNQANDALKAGQLLKAIEQQQIARDQLRLIAKDLNPPATAVDALNATAAELAKLIEDQKGLQTQTNAAVGVKPRVTGLDDQQAGLVDRTNTLQQDMQTLSPTSAGLVKEAIDPMQASRTELGSTNPNYGQPGRGMRGQWGPWGGGASDTAFTQAAQSQQQAIDKLEEAQKQLQQQLADAQKAADDAAKDPVAKLQDLQKQIQAAMQQQKQVSTETAQATATNPPDPNATAQAQQQQGQVQQQTSALQQTAQPLSLPASQALANAANAMNQAQQSLANPAQAAQAQAQQQAAQAALAQANEQVGQQIAQAQQQAPDPAALAAAANSLQQAQNSVSSAVADATPPASSTTPPSMAQAAAALAAAAKDTQAAAATPGLPQPAAAAVQQAQAAITQGQQNAAKGDAQGTANSAAAAEQALAQAQASVAMAQAGMAGSVAASGPPGPTPGPPGPPDQGPPGTTTAGTMGAGSTDKGTLHDHGGTGKFVSVASRDREAIGQTQQENRPQEYAPMIDQYMKNLADQSSSSP
jgi:hypothetical protein